MPSRPRHTIIVLLPLALHFGQRVARGVAAYARLHHRWRVVGLDTAEPDVGYDIAAHGLIAHSVPAAFEHLPHVVVGRSSGSASVPRVHSDDRQIGQLGAEHLLDRGLRRLAYVGPTYSFAAERRFGFEQAVRDAGAEPLVCPVAYPGTRAEAVTRFVREMADWLVAQARPMGVMASHDNAAALVGQACQIAGLEVPDAVAILGVDNDPVRCELNDPPLSSVEQALDKLGYEAAAVLAGLLEGAPAPAEPLMIPSPGVATRLSTDMLAVEDPDVAATLRHLREHATEPLSIDAVAETVAVARRSLERRFRRTVGRTIQQEITRLRIERACRLLHETELKVEQVGESCGFGTLVHFHATFRRVAGMTPGAWRRQYRRTAG